MSEIIYRVDLWDPGAHLLRITLTIPDPSPSGEVVSLPAWIPGSYMIRDFARNIVSLRISGPSGQAVSALKLDKQTWRVAPVGGPLVISYDVYAWDLSVRGAHFDTTHAYFNGPCVFLRVHGREANECRVELSAPKCEWSSRWRVATTLTPDGAPVLGFGGYRAQDYDELIDHPVEIGDFAYAEFTAAGRPHAIALYGRQEADLARLCRDLARICEEHARLFGDLPLKRYLFLVMAVGQGNGGLEHRDCTSLLCSRNDLPLAGRPEVGEGYRRFLGLCSHEYFHLWNVKRIQPAVLQSADLGTEAYTRLLWSFEGFTSYYDDLGLARCGLITESEYLALLAQTITRVLRGSGRLKQSVADSSFDAWTKFYKQDENAPNAVVSYYAKGSMVGLALDLMLRSRSEGRVSLDTLMQKLWLEYGRPGVGVPEDGIQSLVARLADREVAEFLRQAVEGTEDLPIQDLLSVVGIGMQLRAQQDNKDMGGVVDAFSSPGAPRRTLGLRLQEGPEAVISHVLDGGAGQRAGLAAGDLLLAVDGLRVTPANLEDLLDACPKATVCIHAFRRDELMAFTVTPGERPLDTCELRILTEVDAKVRRLRTEWLRREGIQAIS